MLFDVTWYLFSRTNMQDLIDKTHTQHFELYRRNRLEAMGFSDGDGEKKQRSMQETYELRRQDYMKDIQSREEEMRQSFVNKVKEKEAELKQTEQEVTVQFNICNRLFGRKGRNLCKMIPTANSNLLSGCGAGSKVFPFHPSPELSSSNTVPSFDRFDRSVSLRLPLRLILTF